MASAASGGGAGSERSDRKMSGKRALPAAIGNPGRHPGGRVLQGGTPDRRPSAGRHPAEDWAHPSRALLRTDGTVLNFCANNYLGLADHPRARRGGARRRSTATATAWRRCASSAARRTCTSSSRRRIAAFLGTEDTILYFVAASTPTAGCSRRCSARRTRSSPTR